MVFYGTLLLIALPYMVGYILKFCFNKREISQIETYLIGFFSLFLLQGVVLAGGNILDIPVNELRMILLGIVIAIQVVWVIVLISHTVLSSRRQIRAAVESQIDENPDVNIISARGSNHGIDELTHESLGKSDYILMCLAVVSAVLVVLRIIYLLNYIRMDGMLATVRTSASTGTIFQYNPFTNQPFSIGLIGSRKIISLPIYYSFWTGTFGIDASLFLNMIIILQTYICSLMTIVLLVVPLLHSRRKELIFCIFFNALVLSGDYYSHAQGFKLLHQGYDGAVIVALVMIPYCMYLVTEFYQQELQGSSWSNRIFSIVRLAICALGSIFITTLSSGLLLIVIVLIIMFAVCISRLGKEV